MNNVRHFLTKRLPELVGFLIGWLAYYLPTLHHHFPS